MTRRIPTGLRACLLLACTASLAAGGVTLRPLSVFDADAKGAGLRRPEGVGFDGKSLLAIADTGNKRVLLVTVAADGMTPAGEVRLNELQSPLRVQVTSKGELLALDGRSRRIVRVSRTGEFQGHLQPAGDRASGPFVARSIAIDREDNVFALDISQSRIVVLGTDGRIRRIIAFAKEQRFLSDLAVDGKGTVYAIDSVARRVFVAGTSDAVLAPLTGEMKDEMSFPTALALDDRGRILVADQGGGGIVILGTDGSLMGRMTGMGWKPGQLRYPSGICAGPAGAIVVADRENNRVQVFAVSE